MKKLLALVLCVVMVLSLAPAAFATDSRTEAQKGWNPDWKVGGTHNDAKAGWYSSQTNKNAIDDLNDAIDDMYNALAANQTVFSTAKGMHSLADGLAKGLLADVDDFTYKVYDPATKTYIEHTVDHDDLVDNSRAFLKAVIGTHITDYMNDRSGRWIDTTTYVPADTGKTSECTGKTANSNLNLYVFNKKIYALNPANGYWYEYVGSGKTLDDLEQTTSDEWQRANKDGKMPTHTEKTIDYEKYLDTYVAAVNNALTSSKAQKGIEAFAYALATVAIQDSVNDKLDDLRDEIIDWNDASSSKWNEFGFDPISTDFDNLFSNVNPIYNSSDVFVPGSGLTWNEYQTAVDIATGDAAALITGYVPAA
jgi:hypothetical protein